MNIFFEIIGGIFKMIWAIFGIVISALTAAVGCLGALIAASPILAIIIAIAILLVL